MKGISATRGRILIMEDESAISRLCNSVLTKDGFEVEISVNGEIAKQKVEESDFDLILVDIRTPVMNGLKFFQFLTGKHPELSARVIFTTGDFLEPETRSFLESSGRPLLAKPFDPDDLRTIVSESFTGRTK